MGYRDYKFVGSLPLSHPHWRSCSHSRTGEAISTLASAKPFACRTSTLPKTTRIFLAIITYSTHNSSEVLNAFTNIIRRQPHIHSEWVNATTPYFVEQFLLRCLHENDEAINVFHEYTTLSNSAINTMRSKPCNGAKLYYKLSPKAFLLQTFSLSF